MKSNQILIIAEAGVNHNGSLDLALKMVDIAADAGADLVKFQTFSAERLVVKDAPKAAYQKSATSSEESQQEMLRRLELSRKDHEVLIRHCSKRGIGFFSTGFDIESVDMLHSLGQKMFKIPSGEITNLPYIKHIGKLGAQVILSTGMANLGEIEAALQLLEHSGTPRSKVVVLHCTTEYPAPYNDVNLRVLPALRSSLGVEVGYSDHTLGTEVSIAAVALGAIVIEKHFTLDPLMPGPDQSSSLDPQNLMRFVSAIRNIEIALGSSVKGITPSEIANSKVVRKSIVASRVIRSGEVFTSENLTTKRPGTGISPMRWDEIVGRRADRDYGMDELIKL